MMKRAITLLLAGVLFLTTSYLPASPPESDETEISFIPNTAPTLRIERVRGNIIIDGKIDDSGWERAAVADNFVETYPGDLVKPPVETRVLLAYDDEHLYVAFIARDDPSAIRSSLRDRDEIFSDDYVGLLLDTYGDAAAGYEIFVNPIGIQGDLQLTQQGEDGSFDMIFKSKGRITDDGFQVELAIPFSSLRFPDREQQIWRVNFWRNHPRDSRRRYSWSTISRDDPCFMCQWGTLTGIDDVQPGNSLELLPSVVGFQSGELNDFDDPNSGFDNKSFDGEASLGMRYALTPSISVEGTINPDFSQIESDADQADVNTTFALFFPERRPFFQEGSDLYDTWINVVYTRSINDPIGAAKFTGRAGRISFGYIGARDDNTAIILPFEESSEFASVGKSFANIFRLRQTFGKDSYIGAMLTDRRTGSAGAGSVIGADGLLRFANNLHFEWQLAGSRTREPNDTTLSTDFNDQAFDNDKYTAAFDGEDYWGSAVYASLERDARTWSFDIDYWHWSPAFRADNGFVFRNDLRQVNIWTGLQFNRNNSFIDQIQPGLQVSRIWNFDGLRKDEWIQPQLSFNFKRQIYLWMSYLYSNERFGGQELDHIRRLMLNFDTNFSHMLSFGFFTSLGRFVARNEDPVVLGKNGVDLQLWGTVKPAQRLILEPSLVYSRLDHPADGSRIFEGYILRTRINYQFTREFFLRLVLQYNEFGDRVNIEPLLTYKLNPFTIFYIGAANQLRNYRPDEDRTDFTTQSRQLFFKFQYLFQI